MMTQDTYRERRERLMERFGDRDVIFLRGNSAVQRNADIEYRFRQDSNVRYLTGVDLPDAAVLLLPKERKYILFASEFSVDEQVWTGSKPSLEEMGKQFEADEAYPIGDVRKVVRRYKRRTVHSLRKHSSPFHPRRKQLAEALAEMRLVKSPEEIAEMESAVGVAAKAVDALMRSTKPGANEQELEAVVEFIWRSHGADYAFPSIVTQEGAILHSMYNTGTLEDNRLVLIDIGCEYNGYCSDISRTFPVNGRFTPEQAAIYDIVLKAKEECTEMVGPGISMEEVQKHSERVIAQGLLDYGILKGDLDTILEKEVHKLFYMHGVTHWLGMDVHEALVTYRDMAQRCVLLAENTGGVKSVHRRED